MPPQYRYSGKVLFSISRDLILGRKRSFSRDAAELVKGIYQFERIGHPPVDSHPLLFLINHYSRPGFRAWWISLALVAAASREVHWSMTSAWTYPDPLRSRLITPLTEWVLVRLANMYGFTSMPPMPPRGEDTLRRAEAVRSVLRLARSIRPAIAMAPEGMDSPDGRLMRPPPGAGRFIAHLAGEGYALIPVGAYEEGDAFRLVFGAAFRLPKFSSLDPDVRDREAIAAVMKAIAELLPEGLRGSGH